MMPVLSGCEAGYYWQAVTGHTGLMRQTRPVSEVVADATVPDDRRAQLETALAAVDFAHTQLKLPDNGSYRTFAELDAPYVVWNVVAAPALSLEPRTWCFPVAGCVNYRGYFAEDAASAYAAELAADGYDVSVSGAVAYSTLGRFADPLLSSMLSQAGARVAGVVFHELAHQLLYVSDDSPFNEGFASFVEREGLRRWLSTQPNGNEQALCQWALGLERQRQLGELLATFRAALAVLYAQPAAEPNLRTAKAALLAALPVAYQRMADDWDGPPTFAHWFDRPFNNARFALLTTYENDIPAFAALLAEADGDLQRFYALAAELAEQPAEARRKRIEALKLQATAGPEMLRPGCDMVASAS